MATQKKLMILNEGIHYGKHEKTQKNESIHPLDN
jgi:hypothetical protein